ncbi:FtsX-like permease family [Citrobacter koseri]|nr:FtsX-like permease family [Citrobacter koseri]
MILALSSLCVNTTLMAIVGERAREFALQKALGSSNGDIVRQILLETSIHRAGGGGVRLGAGIFAGATVGINGV